MSTRIEFADYNFRRYSRPWIAEVTAWPVGGKATLRWGNYLGDTSGGMCEIDVPLGGVIRYGQKDLRKPNRSLSQWAIVVDGGVEDCTEAEAASAYRLHKQELQQGAVK